MGRKPLKAKTTKSNERKNYQCVCCGKEYVVQKGNFPLSQSSWFKSNGYYLPFCKHCIDEKLEQYTEQLGDEDEAMRRICCHTDTYYLDDIALMARNATVNRSRFSIYISRSHMKQYTNKTYDNTMLEERRNTINTLEDLHENNAKLVEPEEDGSLTNTSPAVSPEDIKHWGYGKTADDYQWLNDKYDEMRSTNVIDSTTRDELVRDYCMQKLLQNNALMDGKIELYNKLADTAQKTLDRANLTPKIEDAADKAGEKPIGVMIQMFEKEDPVPEPRPEWKDVDGIIRLFTIYFLGHLMKMLGIKNRYATMYEEEMAKYRAEVSEIKNADDEEVFEYLINGEGKFHENTSYEGGEAYGI